MSIMQAPIANLLNQVSSASPAVKSVFKSAARQCALFTRAPVLNNHGRCGGVVFAATAALLLSLMAPSALAAIDKVTSSTPLTLATPSQPIAMEALLDIGITALDDGLDLTDEDDTVFPEVRMAESVYFSSQLLRVLEKSGAWGAVRVVPVSYTHLRAHET